MIGTLKHSPIVLTFYGLIEGGGGVEGIGCGSLD